MARCAAIERSKELKFLRNQKESELFNIINILLTKSTLSSDEEMELKEIQLKIDQMYKDLAKGAFIRSRAKWLEEGETNSSYFFALEKRNGRRKSLDVLNINGTHCSDITKISNFVSSFFSALYTSKFDDCECKNLISKLIKNVPAIKDDFKTLCDSQITVNEIKTALFSMKKGKAPVIDGLSVEFYIHFWDLIQNPLFYMYKDCISQREMSTTMKQGIVSLIPKPDKDVFVTLYGKGT